MARLTFYGATEGVTGSVYLLETARATVLLECGLVQGTFEQEKTNRERFPFDIAKLDGVVLSHAHLDHTGRLPKLVANGYNGPVYVTYPTRDLLEIMLKDAAYLEQRDCHQENKRRLRTGRPKVAPLYEIDDVEAALKLCVGIDYGQRREIADGVKIRYRDAGHILGSAVVEVFITERSTEKTLVFSGDLGNSSAALLRDPAVLEKADVLLLESTYGDRDHRSMDETLAEFESIIAQASRNGGNILIPAFAVGRTQEIIFRLGQLYQDRKLKQQTVYLDSPMAISATEIYQCYQHMYDRADRAALSQSNSGNLQAFLPVLRYSRTASQSMAINKVRAGAIIIAGSGMCNGGRIRHHLKHNLWRTDSHVVFVGFQALGTPGRSLVNGATTFRMGGEEIVVKAKIHTLGGFSAHADQQQLLDWVASFQSKPSSIHLVHGEPGAKSALREKLLRRGRHTVVPARGASIAI